MSSTKQIEANRRNARKSTGPRSPQGKAVSRMNALKTGIDAASLVIRGEDPAALEALAAEYCERFQPATPEQRALIDTLISSDWLLRRFRFAEAQLWELELEDLQDRDNPVARAFLRKTDAFARLQRRLDSAERHYHRALKGLLHVQAEARAGAPPPSVGIQSASPQNGFVPQLSGSAPAGPIPIVVVRRREDVHGLTGSSISPQLQRLLAGRKVELVGK